MCFNVYARGNRHDMEIKIGGVILPMVRHMKFLGVYLDDNLNWNEHIKQLQLKLKSRFCLLNKGKHLLSVHAKRTLYYAQIHSNLLYGILMWGNMAPKADLTKLRKLQDRCVNTIDLHSNIESIYNKHKILTLDEIIKLENSKRWYKYYHCLLPKKLQ